MKKSAIIWIVIIVVVLGGLWWWMNANNNQTPASPTGSEPQTPVAAILKTSTDATLGTYLVAANGMTLYLYTKDTANVTNCYDQCAIAWPPYTVSATTALSGSAGMTGAISTVTRKDGTLQLAYNGVPLYFWQKDIKPGDTTGQNVGGVWFVVKP